MHDWVTGRRAGNRYIHCITKEISVLKNGDLYDALAGTSRHYITLKSKFNEFVGHFAKGFEQSDALIKGISVNASTDTDQVDIVFVGMTLRLVFSVAITESLHRPVGIIRCYSLVNYPEAKLIETCNFTFKPNGESNLNDATDNDPLYVNNQWSARYIGLHLIHESLVKNYIINEEATQCATN